MILRLHNLIVQLCKLLLTAAILLGVETASADLNAENPYILVPGAALQTALPKQGIVSVKSFLLQRHPVTNAEFLAFISTHTQWRRTAVSPIFAGADYLSHWQSADALGPQALPLQPVTRVSWFAASAYCEAQNARLPTWYEWELATAADATQRDARADPVWRQHILDWYARPSSGILPNVERDAANVYGLHDLPNLVWEWVEDFNSLVIGGTGTEKFCGSGALSLEQKENYAVLMRVAMLDSLRAADSGHTLGFRCARNLQEPTR